MFKNHLKRLKMDNYNLKRHKSLSNVIEWPRQDCFKCSSDDSINVIWANNILTEKQPKTFVWRIKTVWIKNEIRVICWISQHSEANLFSEFILLLKFRYSNQQPVKGMHAMHATTVSFVKRQTSTSIDVAQMADLNCRFLNLWSQCSEILC